MIRLALLALLLGGCGEAVTVPAWSPPFGFYELSPPPAWYRQVWDSTVACMAETHPVRGEPWTAMHWYVVPGEYVAPTGNGGWAAGVSHYNQIFISGHLFEQQAHWVVAHEIIHSAGLIGLLYGSPEEHPADPFNRCLWRMYPNDFPGRVQ